MSCPDCFSGHVHTGTPKGQVTRLHGLDVYVAEPSAGPVRGIVIIVPDAFGWEFVNNRILADHYAEKGNYKVYLPEFMNGNAAPVWLIETIRTLTTSKSFGDYVKMPYHIAWAASAFIPFMFLNRFGKSWPIVRSFFESVRQNEGARLPIGVAGFCWGGKHAIYLAHGAEIDGKPLINASFTGHPSFLNVPGDIEKINIPVSLAVGDLDSVVTPVVAKEIEKILSGKDGEVKIYVGAGHGFCVRADSVLSDASRQAAESEDQAIDWFTRHFAAISL
ncbi:hypothetical protein FE257_012304 [Aspergillus nanangensis]|uniref:Dienelactone hydrolase domain-containing protein n=1 Tax=Aspergillus nanangensis TaxID=2582783 RepID=A0AAD4CGF2_ASPNN|nr:hypothetical protein FE257_012304 [Aspergillus nanangensis]